MCVSYLWISRLFQQAKRSTSLAMTIWLRITLVAETRQQQRLDKSHEASLLIQSLELRKSSNVFSTRLYLWRVSICSFQSETMFPMILIAYFFIYSSLEWRAPMIASIDASSDTMARIDSSSLLFVSSYRVLKTISYFPGIYFIKVLKEIFLSQMWLMSTHNWRASASTILMISASLPMILLPAAMTAISRMSTEFTLKQVGRSCQNSFTTA